MKFWIVTPSYEQVDWLRLCIASIADQASNNIVVHHHVQDGGSKDGTLEFLKQYETECPPKNLSNYSFSFQSMQDNGMYDALNKGFDLAPADTDILAWLNCDEQYLAGTLDFVNDYFDHNGKVDMLFGDMLLVDPNGDLICYRKSHHPRWPYITCDYLYVFSCTMFVRRRVFEDGYRLNADLKDVADEEFVTRVLRAGYCARHVRKYFSTFTWTERNMSTGANARREALEMLGRAPAWVRFLKPILSRMRLTEKFLSGCYLEKTSIQYSIFTQDSNTYRKRFSVKHPSWRWPGNSGAYTK